MAWGQPWVKGPVGTLEWVVRKGLNPAEAGSGAAGVLECVALGGRLRSPT